MVGEWEAAARPARDAGKRVVNVRTGIVQSARGGSLALLRRLFTTGLGGPLAPGSQWVSWIGLDDLLDVYGRSLGDEALEGPLTGSLSEPVTNRQYARILAGVLHRPALVPVPRSVHACSSAPRRHASWWGRASVWSPTVWRPGATSTGIRRSRVLGRELGSMDSAASRGSRSVSSPS